jgi:cytochrome c553
MHAHQGPALAYITRLQATVLLGSALFLGFAPIRGVAAAEPDPELRARQLVTTVCANCHGADGNSTQPSYPKLAGLQAAYIKKQIREFVSGARKHEAMSPVALRLTEDEVQALADFFSGKSPSPGQDGDPQLAARGRAIYFEGNVAAGLPSCDGCHAADGTGSPRFPRLAGQHADYLYKQLDDIKHGRRNTSPLMRAVSERLSADEMRALAVYLGGL